MNMQPETMLKDVLGSTLTTMKVGGTVAYYARVRTIEEIATGISYAKEIGIPYTVMGAGSNLLIADEGYVGLLMHISGGTMRVLSPEETGTYSPFLEELEQKTHSPRYTAEDKPGLLRLQVNGVTNNEGEIVLVEMSAGIPWGQAVAFTLKEKLDGLQWYARIPCTVGGAVYNTIHAEHHLVSEVVCAVRAYNPETGEEKIIGVHELALGYDYSIFHTCNLIITSVIFALKAVSQEQTQANQALYLGWTGQKSLVQPSGPSAGSVFKNFTPEIIAEKGYIAVAAGWYIDKAGLKGYCVGGMQVYSGHANFIINTGVGTQKNFRELVAHIRMRVFNQFQLVLEPEIECWDLQGNTIQWPLKI
jgi:UDP-N-acetylmuramate dehydrogenase